jgi:Protein of unknown function (DUF3108)
VTASAPTSSPLDSLLHQAEARAGARTRRVLLVALVLSLLVHLAFTLWPADVTVGPDATPLTATLTEMPAPPKPSAIAQVPPKPKVRKTSPIAAPTPTPVDAVPEPATTDAPGAAAVAAEAPKDDATATAATAAAEVIPGAATGTRTLPPRVDLAYKVFYGTQGFLIGEAVYRFEHANNRYRIATIGEARGLAALVLRGQGKIESRGLITDEGLLPQTFRVERGGPDRVETATFDWETGIVTMFENKTAPLDMPTFDPLSLMWQYYFTPPTATNVTFTVATPRRVQRYTITREETEKIEWSQGTIDAERWHRRSDDGKTDAYVWLAPSLHYIAVKMRVSNTSRGTIEVVLDGIRVDENAAAVTSGELALPRASDVMQGRADAPAPTWNSAQPAATFPTMTGQ